MVPPEENKDSSSDTTETPDTIPQVSVDLDDLEVVAMRHLIKSDGAKLEYDLQEDISAKGLTLSDALRKVPMITVDGEGNIRINGQENFKIYVNGKEDPSLTARYKDLFKSMPADAVRKVEVMTEPGAKYDAEGTAGILNLVTISRNSTDGYAATLNAIFTKKQTGVSLYGRMKHGRLYISANLDYVNGSIFPQRNWNENRIENLSSSEMHYQYNRIQQKVVWDYIGGGVNLSYDLTDNDLITLNTNVTTMNGRLNKGCFSLLETRDENCNLIGSSKRRLDAGITETSLNTGLSWQHSFSPDGAKLILSYLFNHGYDDLDAKLIEIKAEGLQVAAPYEHTLNKNYNNEHTIQLDYVKPLGSPNHSLDAGAKMIFRRNPAKSLTLWHPEDKTASGEPDIYSDILQKQDIYAAYLSYSGHFGSFSATAGLRYEHTGMGIDFRHGDGTDFFNRLNDLVPNIAAAYNFNPASALRLAYQMRISRPSLRQVNPYEQILIPGTAEKGNPDLESERVNKLSITYSNYGRTVGGNIGLEYSLNDNAISRFIYYKDGINYSSYANIGHRKDFALFGYLSWSPLQTMQISLDARLNHADLSSKHPYLHNSGWTLNYGANINCLLPAKIRLNIYGGQSTRSYNIQGWQDGWYYYGLGLSRGLLKNDALTISLTAQQFLQKETTNSSYMASETMINRFTFHNSNWNVGVTLTWNVGSLKSDVKKTVRKIENDDKSSVAGQSAI